MQTAHLLSTRDTVAALRAANPGRAVSEDLIRAAIRKDLIKAPAVISGSYVWTGEEVSRLAQVLGLRSPSHD